MVLMRMNPDNSEQFSVELVIARYNEDLRWLRRVPESVIITVYNKGEDLEFYSQLPVSQRVRVRQLPNIGREAHSYLTHLSHCYDSLAAVTIFSQGHPFDHAPDFHASIRSLAEGSKILEPFRWYGFLDETDDPHGRRLFVPWSKNPERRELSTGRLYEELLGELSPQFFHFRGGAQFAVTKEAIQQRAREFYERALTLTLSWPDAAHCLERFWDRLFGSAIIDPATLSSQGVRYWKPIRRLEAGIRKAGKSEPFC